VPKSTRKNCEKKIESVNDSNRRIRKILSFIQRFKNLHQDETIYTFDYIVTLFREVVSQLWCTGFEIITARDRVQPCKELETEELVIGFNGALGAGAGWH